MLDDLPEVPYPSFECCQCSTKYKMDDGFISCVSFDNQGDDEKKHLICIDCIRNKAENAAFDDDSVVANGGVGLCCVYDDCNNVFLLSDFDMYLNPDIQFSIMKRLQDESLKTADINDLVKCSGCNSFFSVDENVPYFDCECGRIQCRKCPRIYDDNHKSKTCDEMENSAAAAEVPQS